MAAGFFRGTSLDQDYRYANKAKAALKAVPLPEGGVFDQKVDMRKVSRPVVDGWVTQRITALLGLDDDVLAGYVLNSLNSPSLTARELYVTLEPMLNKHTVTFVTELWNLLVSAQSSPGGIPASMLAARKAELAASAPVKPLINPAEVVAAAAAAVASMPAAPSRRRYDDDRDDGYDRRRRRDSDDEGRYSSRRREDRRRSPSPEARRRDDRREGSRRREERERYDEEERRYRDDGERRRRDRRERDDDLMADERRKGQE